MADYSRIITFDVNAEQLIEEITAAISAPTSLKETITTRTVNVSFSSTLSAPDEALLYTTIDEHIPAFGIGLHNIKLFSAVDANASSTTKKICLGAGIKHLAMFVEGKTGAHANHIITLEMSPDGVTWFDTPHTVTGEGNDHYIETVCDSIRAKVTTLEGVASTVDITIMGK